MNSCGDISGDAAKRFLQLTEFELTKFEFLRATMVEYLVGSKNSQATLQKNISPPNYKFDRHLYTGGS